MRCPASTSCRASEGAESIGVFAGEKAVVEAPARRGVFAGLGARWSEIEPSGVLEAFEELQPEVSCVWELLPGQPFHDRRERRWGRRAVVLAAGRRRRIARRVPRWTRERDGPSRSAW